MHKLTLSLVAATTAALCATAAVSAVGAAGFRSSERTTGEATVLKGKKKPSAARRGRVAAYSKRGKTAKRAGTVRTAAATKGPGSCGTFMYWKDGKCQDARAKK